MISIFEIFGCRNYFFGDCCLIKFYKINKIGIIYRFLIKRTSDEYISRYLQPVKVDEKVAYINIALNSPFADFKITSIQPGYDFPNEDIVDVEEIINTYRSKHIITVEDPVEFVFSSKKSLVEQREV